MNERSMRGGECLQHKLAAEKAYNQTVCVSLMEGESCWGHSDRPISDETAPVRTSRGKKRMLWTDPHHAHPGHVMWA